MLEAPPRERIIRTTGVSSGNDKEITRWTLLTFGGTEFNMMW